MRNLTMIKETTDPCKLEMVSFKGETYTCYKNNGWQPMETAPTDGTEIWLAVKFWDARDDKFFYNIEKRHFQEGTIRMPDRWNKEDQGERSMSMNDGREEYWQPYIVPEPPVIK